MSSTVRVVTVIGTRPDVIKLAPVIWGLEADPRFESVVVCTGQHREMIDDLLELLSVRVDHDLAIMRAGQSLSQLSARLLAALEPVLQEAEPDLVVVQGDTTSALCGALSAFYRRTPVAHVEAGLRTPVADDPFPEEMNRRLVSRLARVHFAPTRRSAVALLEEGVDPDCIEITGNTVIDALRWVTASGRGTSAFPTTGRRRCLVTLHRRESQGMAMAAVARALGELAGRGDVDFVLPLHCSPAVRESLVPSLEGRPGITLTEPLGYADLAATLNRCDFVITDSGGIQEEAPALGKPVLVVRESTERPEAVEAGVAELVGLDPARLIASVRRLLDNPGHYRSMARPVSPFGDGQAASRIVQALASRWRPELAAGPAPATVAPAAAGLATPVVPLPETPLVDVVRQAAWSPDHAG